MWRHTGRACSSSMETAGGRYAFWAVRRTVKVVRNNALPTPLQITAQEIVTNDRVAIRKTLTAFTRAVVAGGGWRLGLPPRAVRHSCGCRAAQRWRRFWRRASAMTPAVLCIWLARYIFSRLQSTTDAGGSN